MSTYCELLQWISVTYKLGLFLHNHLHPLLPKVQKVHDGTQDGQSSLLFCENNKQPLSDNKLMT